MGLIEWLMIRDLNAANARLRTIHSRSSATRTAQATRLRRLEEELGRVRLLAFALAELCRETGLITAEELQARLTALDRSDGTEDGQLTPGRPMPGSPPS